MKIKNVGWDRYAEIKIDTTGYCQSCGKDFEGIEIVFYASLDNNIVCKKCAKAHAEVEPRLYIEEE